MLLNGPDATSSGTQEHPGKYTFADEGASATSCSGVFEAVYYLHSSSMQAVHNYDIGQNSVREAGFL